MVISRSFPFSDANAAASAQSVSHDFTMLSNNSNLTCMKSL